MITVVSSFFYQFTSFLLSVLLTTYHGSSGHLYGGEVWIEFLGKLSILLKLITN